MDIKVATGSYFVKPAAHSTRGLVTLSGYAPLPDLPGLRGLKVMAVSLEARVGPW